MVEVRYIDIADLKKIREFFYYRDRVVMLCLLNFGVNVAIRISDLLNLKFEDIPKNNIISIVEKKTNKRKVFPLNKVCLKAVADLKKHYKALGYDTKTGYLFKSSNREYVKYLIDKPITRYAVSKHLNEAKDYLNIDYPISTHSFRKTFGHYFYLKTGNIALLMQIFNHSSQAVTLRYIGITQDDINEAYLGMEL